MNAFRRVAVKMLGGQDARASATAVKPAAARMAVAAGVTYDADEAFKTGSRRADVKLLKILDERRAETRRQILAAKKLGRAKRTDG